MANGNYPLKNREMHIEFIDPVKAKNDPINDPVKITILHHLKLNPSSNYTELAESIGYSVSTIKRHIQALKKLGLIERIGSDKTGYWKIIKNSHLRI
jgi:predicted HTH transcriptional regulator